MAWGQRVGDIDDCDATGIAWLPHEAGSRNQREPAECKQQGMGARGVAERRREWVSLRRCR